METANHCKVRELVRELRVGNGKDAAQAEPCRSDDGQFLRCNRANHAGYPDPTASDWPAVANKEISPVATLYTRTFAFKDSLSDEQVLKEWQFAIEEISPAILRVSGVRSAKFYSGAGALRADLSALVEMDDASVYERLLLDAGVRKHLGRMYGDWELSTAGQSFRREVTAELIHALSSTG
jgi:hypothetical protein